MDTNQLKEQIRQLNQKAQLEHQQRREAALNKIREQRRAIREQQERHRDHA